MLPDISGRIFEPTVIGGEHREIEHSGQKCGLIESPAPVDTLRDDRVGDIAPRHGGDTSGHMLPCGQRLYQPTRVSPWPAKRDGSRASALGNGLAVIIVGE